MTVPMVAYADDLKIGTMIARGPDASSLPLEHTDVVAHLTGPVATVSITQRFGNPFAHPVDLEYLFPVPHEAAVVSFEFRIGGRIVKSRIDEVDAARRDWEAARATGRRAGLVEERRPNLLSIELANVQAHETVIATIRYYERLHFDDGAYAFVFPMGLTPKYHRDPSAAAKTDAPIAAGGSPIGPVELQISIDAGMVVGDPVSPSHAVEVSRLDGRRLQVKAAGHVIPNKDFVLRLPVSEEAIRGIAWVANGSANSNTALIAAIPPRLDRDAEPPSREFVFVIDRSGSMSDGPMDQARNALRACLRSFAASDTFTILAFDDHLEWYSQASVEATQKSVDSADRWLEQIQARGGTDIESAVHAALSLPVDASRQRYIVFLTDGAVSAERDTIHSVRTRLGNGRLFTFGIGPAVNRALLAGMAKAGRGTAEFLQVDEDIEAALIRFQDRVGFPAVQDVRVEWKGATAWDVYPEQQPDLYYGQTLELTARIRTIESGAKVIVSGKRAGVAWQTEIPLGAPADEPAIAHIWAKARIDALLEDIDENRGSIAEKRAEVIALATEHRVLSRYTSFVAIDDQQTGGGEAQHVRVSVPLPEGLKAEAFGMALAAMPPTTMGGRAIADSVSPALLARAGNGESVPMQRAPGVKALTRIKLFTPKPDDPLRRLARSQNTSGSWGSGETEVEATAAAILEFVRSGHTTSRGDYRRQLRKAIKWLLVAEANGKAATLRAEALSAMAEATGDASLTSGGLRPRT